MLIFEVWFMLDSCLKVGKKCIKVAVALRWARLGKAEYVTEVLTLELTQPNDWGLAFRKARHRGDQPGSALKMEHRYTLRVNNVGTGVQVFFFLASVSKASAEAEWDYSVTEMAHARCWLPSVPVRFCCEFHLLCLRFIQRVYVEAPYIFTPFSFFFDIAARCCVRRTSCAWPRVFK